MYYAINDFPADCGWMFCVVFQIMRWVVVDPIGCYDFYVDYHAFGGVGFNDCYCAFAHTWYSIHT